MSQRLDRLKQLLQIKKEVTHSAYQDFLKAQEQFKQYQLKNDQLGSYRHDYLTQVETMRKKGTVVPRSRNRIDFISHLDTALIQLNAHLAYLAKVKTKAELYYKQAKISEEGISQLIERVSKSQQLKLQCIETRK